MNSEKEKNDSILKYFASRANSATLGNSSEPAITLTINRPSPGPQPTGNPMIVEKQPMITFMGISSRPSIFLQPQKQQPSSFTQQIMPSNQNSFAHQPPSTSGIRPPPPSKSFQTIIDLEEMLPGAQVTSPSALQKPLSSSGSSSQAKESVSQRIIARPVRQAAGGSVVAKASLQDEGNKRGRRVASKSKVGGSSQQQANSVTEWLGCSEKHSRSQQTRSKGAEGKGENEPPKIMVKRAGDDSGDTKKETVIEVEEQNNDEEIKETGKIQISTDVGQSQVTIRSTSNRGKAKGGPKPRQVEISNFMQKTS